MPDQPTITPFQEAINFLKAKKNVPTSAYYDVWQDEHAKSFMVAGVMRDDILSSLHTLVDDSSRILTILGVGKISQDVLLRGSYMYMYYLRTP